jgi:hypothetical protein
MAARGLPVGSAHEYNLSQDTAMRRIVAPSIIASLLALACGTAQDSAGKADEVKTAPAEAEAKAEILGAPEQPAAPVEPPPEVDTAVPPPEPAPPPQPAPPPKEPGAEFCATIIPCYQQLEFAGSFTADVSVDIEPDGSVSAVSFTGDTPKPIKSCITDAIKNITLSEYNGKPGRTRCTKSGQLMGGTQMIMSDRTYEVRDPAASKLEANAKPKGKAKGKANAG